MLNTVAIKYGAEKVTTASTEPLPTTSSNCYFSPNKEKPHHDTIYSCGSSNKRLSSQHTPTLETEDVADSQQHLIKRNGYSIRLVESPDQMERASQFLKKRYASKGYLTESEKTAAFSFNPNQITFEAFNEQHIFGTITLTITIDSGEGLLANKLYGDEIDVFRKKGRKVCELSKFASSTQSSSKEVLASLFHLAYIYAYVIHNTKDAFIEVNPRHSSFYKRMLGFCQIGEERMCERVNAPAVLLHLDLDYMSTQISTLAGQANQKSRSIYPCFMPKLDEKRLTNKIRDILDNYDTQIDPNIQLA